MASVVRSARHSCACICARIGYTSRRWQHGGDRTTTFGFQQVTEAEKAEKVQQVFTNVASSYDVMNDVMSVGLHRIWKDWFVQQLSPTPGTRILDVAGGTGDIAYRLLDYVPHGGEGQSKNKLDITVVDVNGDMLQEGMSKRNDSEAISWVLGDAMALPFPGNSFDAYTIVFGIRNVPNIRQAVAEAHRVLVPGGRFLCMEFSHIQNPILKQLYDIYSFQLIPVYGELIAQDRSSYQYLVESIRQFPTPDEMADLMAEEGFCHVKWERLLSGVVALHSAFKPANLNHT